MSNRREFDKLPADLNPANLEIGTSDQAPAVPVIHTGGSRPARAVGKRAEPARKPGGGFDAAAIARMVQAGGPEGEPAVSENAGDSANSTGIAAGSDSNSAATAAAATASVVRDEGGTTRQPVEVANAAAPVAENETPENATVAAEVPPVPFVRASSKPVLHDRKRAPAAGKRPSGHTRRTVSRKKKPLPAIWIAVGGGGVCLAILLALVIGGSQSGNGQRRSNSRSRPAASESSASRPAGRSFQPGPFSPDGVRRMDPAEQARRRERINSFAEMGRAEEAKLHAEQQQQDGGP